MNIFTAKEKRIETYLKENEAVAVNDAYISACGYLDTPSGNPNVFPMSILDVPQTGLFETDERVYPSPLDIMKIYDNSRETFNIQDEYFYYDDVDQILYSSNHPYADGMIDADIIARFCVKYDDDLSDDVIRSILDEE